MCTIASLDTNTVESRLSGPQLNVHLENKIPVTRTSTERKFCTAHARVGRANEFANMAPKFKKPTKIREVSGPLHGRFSAKKHVYGQLRDAATHSHHASA